MPKELPNQLIPTQPIVTYSMSRRSGCSHVPIAMAISTGLFVKRRGLSMLTMTASVAVIGFFVLHYNAGEVVDYGYDPV